MAWNIFGGKKKEKNKQAPIESPAASVNERKFKRDEIDENGFYNPVCCPYCLEEYSYRDIEFRAGTSDTNEIDGHAPEDDEKFEKFWENMKQPRNNVTLNKVLSFESDIDRYRLRGDSEPRAHRKGESAPQGLVAEVWDKYGNPSKNRICPHCHNPLPEGIGYMPHYIISMMGNTQAGKTVYLVRLIHMIYEGMLLRGREYAVSPAKNERSGEMIKLYSEAFDHSLNSIRRAKELREEKKALVRATGVVFQEPCIYQLQCPKYDETGKRIGFDGFILTLYDFPGEAIFYSGDASQSGFVHTIVKRISKNIDGWVFLFDSGTVPVVKQLLHEHGIQQTDGQDHQADQLASPRTVLEAFRDNYAGSYELGMNKPVAFVLSKSDIVREFQQEIRERSSNLGTAEHPPRWLQPEPGNSGAEIDMDDLLICSDEVCAFVDDHMLNRTIRDHFPEFMWFGVSSTGAMIDGGQYAGHIAPPLRVLSPVEWILYRLGEIKGDRPS